MNTIENDKKDRDLLSRQVNFYVPTLVDKLLRRLQNETPKTIALYGFGEAMKWLNRILKEQGNAPQLYDWRTKYVGWDCGGDTVTHISELKNSNDLLLVFCVENVNDMKAGAQYLLEHAKLAQVPAIYEAAEAYKPILQESPYKEIRDRARARAISMIEDEKLFNLMQIVRAVNGVPGDIAEFGCFQGGSAAIIVEAVNHFEKRPVWLFDTFKGIPPSKYGLDYRWKQTFTNNSYAQVKDIFSDAKNVQVINGPIQETHNKLDGKKLAFCHIAIDTAETAELLLNYVWPMLSSGGIIGVDDYGAFPNCLPLTIVTDRFFKDKKDVVLFHTAATTGFFAIKR